MLQYLPALAPFVPLAQTLLWIVLIVGFVVWFDKPIRQILSAVQQRIATGSAVKAGWFELSELKTQAVEEQRERAQTEIAEAVADDTTANSRHGSGKSTTTSEKFLLVEDLALRALQADLGVALNRQISAGHGAAFDAAYAKGGKLHVVEVKFYPGAVATEKLRATLDRIANSLERVHWRNVQIVLVLVFNRQEDVYLESKRVDTMLEGFSLPVHMRTYSLSELKNRFGVSIGDA